MAGSKTHDGVRPSDDLENGESGPVPEPKKVRAFCRGPVRGGSHPMDLRTRDSTRFQAHSPFPIHERGCQLMTLSRTMTTKEAAVYLGVSQSSLTQGRMGGVRANRMPVPPFVKLGRKVIYLKEDLDAWLEQHRKVPTYPGSETLEYRGSS